MSTAIIRRALLVAIERDLTPQIERLTEGLREHEAGECPASSDALCGDVQAAYEVLNIHVPDAAVEALARHLHAKNGGFTSTFYGWESHEAEARELLSVVLPFLRTPDA